MLCRGPPHLSPGQTGVSASPLLTCSAGPACTPSPEGRPSFSPTPGLPAPVGTPRVPSSSGLCLLQFLTRQPAPSCPEVLSRVPFPHRAGAALEQRNLSCRVPSKVEAAPRLEVSLHSWVIILWGTGSVQTVCSDPDGEASPSWSALSPRSLASEAGPCLPRPVVVPWLEALMSPSPVTHPGTW